MGAVNVNVKHTWNLPTHLHGEVVEVVGFGLAAENAVLSFAKGHDVLLVGDHNPGISAMILACEIGASLAGRAAELI